MAEGGCDDHDLIEDAEPEEVHGNTSAQTPPNRCTSSPDNGPKTAIEIAPATSRTNVDNRLGKRSADKGKCFDAAIVCAPADDDLGLAIVEEMNQLQFADGTPVDVKFWKDECFGPNKVRRPRKVVDKCRVVFILHTCNTMHDAAVEFTSDEAIAKIRVRDRKSYIRSLCTDNSLEPLVGLEALDAADWIDPVTDKMKQHVVGIITRERRSTVDAKLATLSIQSSDDRCYKMTRGLCVVINIVHFDKNPAPDIHAAAGANEKLKTLFENLKFTVWSYTDKTKDEIKKILEDAGKYMDKEAAIDCFVVYISSHGKEGLIVCKDLKQIRINDIARPFKPDKCPSLKGKPKLFFIDACGTTTDNNLLSDLLSDDESHSETDDIEDFFFGFATQPSSGSYRNNDTGDVYTDEFVKAMKELSDREHLLEIMTEVNRRVKEREVCDPRGEWQKQFPDMKTTLTKKLYFRLKGDV